MSRATTLRSWWSERKAGTEFCNLGAEERGAIARDLRLAPDVLGHILDQGGTRPLELPQMLAELGMDGAEIAREHPGVMRDLEATCAGCGERKQCHRDLARGTAAERFGDYCPNAATIDALLVDKARQAGF